jgi:hypothetical protein
MKYNEDEVIQMIEYSNFLNIPAIMELSCAQMACFYKEKNFE